MRNSRILLQIALFTGWFVVGTFANGTAPTTYCNPIPLPNYPIGRLVREALDASAGSSGHSLSADTKAQHRELADPSALWHDG